MKGQEQEPQSRKPYAGNLDGRQQLTREELTWLAARIVARTAETPARGERGLPNTPAR